MFSLGYVAPLRPALGDDALLLVRPVLGHRVAPQLRMREARHLAARAQLAVAVAHVHHPVALVPVAIAAPRNHNTS